MKTAEIISFPTAEKPKEYVVLRFFMGNASGDLCRYSRGYEWRIWQRKDAM